jgi:uncharacterized protein (TIGR03435 family)
MWQSRDDRESQHVGWRRIRASCRGLRQQFAPEVLEAIGIPMTKLAELRSDDVGRVVIDKTGFTNLFSFRLEFAPVALQVLPADSSAAPFRRTFRSSLD